MGRSHPTRKCLAWYRRGLIRGAITVSKKRKPKSSTGEKEAVQAPGNLDNSLLDGWWSPGGGEEEPPWEIDKCDRLTASGWGLELEEYRALRDLARLIPGYHNQN